jgi:large subunit ribosomal protein L29
MKLKEFREIKNYSKEELLAKLDELEKKYFEIKLKHKTVGIKSPIEIRNLRRDIARIKTLLSQKFNIKK